jgi:tight adherence protein B
MTDVAWALALLAVALVVVVRPSIANARLHSLDVGVDGKHRRWGAGRVRRGTGLLTVSGGAVLGATAHFVFGARIPVLPVLAGMLAGGAAGVLLAGSTAARDRRRRDAELVESVSALAADLRAGRQPADVLATDRQQPHLRSAAVAAVWTVSERTGAPAAAVLDRVEQDLRTRERQHREVAAQLAGARSTAALLAVLPLLGIGLGVAMGARPLHVLLGTERGQVAMLVGAGLDALGLLWTARIVKAAGGET